MGWAGFVVGLICQLSLHWQMDPPPQILSFPQVRTPMEVIEKTGYGSLLQSEAGWRAYSNLKIPVGSKCHSDFLVLPLTTWQTGQIPSLELRRAYEGIIGKIKPTGDVRCDAGTDRLESFRSLARSGPKLTRAFREALFLGEQSALPQDLWESLNYLGLSHLIVVSGSHLSAVLGIVSGLLALLFRYRVGVSTVGLYRLANLLQIVFWLSLWAVEIPLLRAALCFIARSFLAVWIPWFARFRAHQWVGLVGIVLGILYPQEILSRSYLFSFGAAWALAKFFDRRPGSKWAWLEASLYPSCICLLIAQFWGLDSSALSFLANVILGSILIFVITPALMLGLAWPDLDASIEWWLQAFVELLKRLAIFLKANLPGFQLEPAVAIVCLLALILGMHRTLPIARCTGGLILVIGLILSGFQNPHGHRHLEILDVGQGDALLVQWDSKNILIDGGDRPDLANRLKQRGIDRIDLWILTHFDRDHARLFSEQPHRFQIEQVWIPRWDKKREAIQKQSRHLEVVEVGDRRELWTHKELSVEAWSPQASRRGLVRNHHSLVSVFRIRGRPMGLALGDLGAEGEDRIAREWKEGAVSWLKVAHHGSRHSTTEGLLSIIRPPKAIITSGRVNSYGHPSEEVLERLHRWGSKVMSTSFLGSMRLMGQGE